MAMVRSGDFSADFSAKFDLAGAASFRFTGIPENNSRARYSDWLHELFPSRPIHNDFAGVSALHRRIVFLFIFKRGAPISRVRLDVFDSADDFHNCEGAAILSGSGLSDALCRGKRVGRAMAGYFAP